jgi:hypothetical protein
MSALDQQTAAAATALTQDLTNIDSHAASVGNDDNSLTTDVAQAAKDLATTQHDAQTSEPDSASGNADNDACGEASSVARR